MLIPHGLIQAALLAAAAAAAPEAQEDAPGRDSHLGRYLGTVPELAAPRALAFGPDGRLWVGLAGDFATKPRVVPVELAFGEEGSLASAEVGDALGEGRLRCPSGLSIGQDGAVYVSDEELHQIWRLHEEKEPELLCDFGPGPGQAVLPANIAIGGSGSLERLIVCDTGNARVQLIDTTTGQQVVELTGPLVRPTAACAMEDGTIIVVDGARQQLDQFSMAGVHLKSFSDWGSFPSLISTPLGADGLNGLVFVADTENHRIQAFDPNQALPLAYRFGVHAIRPGEGEGKLHYPTDLTIRADGNVLAVAEPLDDRVQLFGRAPGAEPEEDLLRAGIGPPGAHLGPHVAASGQYLVTCSPESHKVQLHDVRLDEPVKIADLFGYGTRLGMLRGPSGLWLGDGGETLLVTDVGNRRLTRVRLKVQPDEPLGQQPDVAVYEDAIDFAHVDFASIPGVDLKGRPAVPIIPGPVCRVDLASGAIIVVADLANEALIELSEDLIPVGLVFASIAPPLGRVTALSPGQDGHLFVAIRDRGRSPGAEVQSKVQELKFMSAEGDARMQAWPVAHASFESSQSVGGVIQRGGELIATLTESCSLATLARETRSFNDSVLRPGWKIRSQHGERGLGRDQFLDPRGVAVLGDGRLVVIDHGNHRGQIFDAEGNFVKGFGSRLYVLPLGR